MSEVTSQDEVTNDDQLFRPTKRRKCYRKRADLEENEELNTKQTPTPPPASLTLDELVLTEGASIDPLKGVDRLDLSVADILRLRKAAQRRKGGIEFSNIAQKPSAEPGSIAQILKDDDVVATQIEVVVNRFAPQTGQVVDVDKHMMAFIDAELAKRRLGSDQSAEILHHPASGDQTDTSATTRIINRQPAALGKLQEIDLGPDARARNIAATEAARRRLEGEDPVEEEPERKGKPRLRRDGKPWRRKRRNSEDVKRDTIVEEILRETRFEIYDAPPSPSSSHPNGTEDHGNEAADERLAEQFRRDFLDAQASRRPHRSAAASSSAASKATGKGDERPKGPKLGGSRSARAAMRERELAEKEKGKGKG